MRKKRRGDFFIKWPLIFVLIFSTAFWASACNEDEALLAQLEELQAKIDEQIEDIADLEEKNSQLIEKNDAITERLTEIEWEYNAPYGEIYALEKAYENKMVTKDDLLTIAYYLNGSTHGNEELMGEDFIPKPLKPEDYTADVERRLFETAAYFSRIVGEYARSDDYSTVDYLGRYEYEDGYLYAVILSFSMYSYPTWAVDKYIDGVCFHFSYETWIEVYYEKEITK